MVDLSQLGMQLEQPIIKVGMHTQFQLEIISFVQYLKILYGIFD